jgi:hypothetical protein
MFRVLTTAIALVSVACVSTHMKKFVGRDARFIELESGPPVNVMDMPDGTRAFQFYWGGGSYVVPERTTTEGQAARVGSTLYYSEERVTRGGFVVDNPGCLVTYFGTWNDAKQGWIVTAISYPKTLVC